MSGPVWAILSGVTYGLFQIVNRRGVARMDIYRATFILLLVSSVVMSLASVFLEDLNDLFTSPIQSILYFALAGLLHFFIGWTLFSESQRRAGAARTGALVGATPLFATVIAWIFLNETLSPLTLLGIVLALAGVYLISKG
jgi:drug/metabolite transporter (DMT)-like permease